MIENGQEWIIAVSVGTNKRVSHRFGDYQVCSFYKIFEF